MPEEKKTFTMPHQVFLEDRRRLNITGVSDVEGFDETVITAYTDHGELTVRGEALHINRLNVETGDLSVEGQIESLTYTAAATKSSGLFGRLFR